MELHVFLAVLAAAAMHAVWNAVVKGGGDPMLSISHMAIAGLVTSGIGLLFVDPPAPAAWPWLIASILLRLAYRYSLVGMYRVGDYGHVYPLARGAAPFLTSAITLIAIGERLTIYGYAGVVALGLGVVMLSLRGGRLGNLDARAAVAALLTSVWISCYSFADGQGARVNGSASDFATWLFFLSCMTTVAYGQLELGRRLWTTFRSGWAVSLGAAAISQLAYFIAIWAMTRAPIALVSALRETSVLVALLISVFVLREPWTSWRIAAAIVITAGAMLLRVG